MKFMFYNCSSLTSFPDITKWKINTIHKIDFTSMFDGCNSLNNKPDISYLIKSITGYSYWENNNTFIRIIQ